MSTRLGTLTLDLVARIGSFTGPIRDAERQAESSFSNMRKHVNNYGAIAVAGAAAVGAGVFAMANEYANAARELQAFAQISNTTTQEFQKMAVGAQTMGISQEQLSDQLKDFNEKLGEFITIGSGGAVDFFEQIAVKTEGSAEGARKLALEMQNLSGPKALQLYVDKLEEAGVTQQQMSFYLESMASDTTNLIPLLKDGGKGFEYWADAAERAGVVMDESAIAKANELAVHMDLLNLQVQGAKNQFIQGLMPALVSVGDGMSSAAYETNIMKDSGEMLGEVFKGVAATGMGVYAVIKMLTNSVAGLSVEIVKAKQITDNAAEGGSWADKLPGVKLFKTGITAGVMARAPDSAVAMAAADNAKVVEDVGNSINRMYNNTVNEAVSAMAKIQSSNAGVVKGSDEWIKKQNESAKAAKENTKANNDLNRVLEEQQRIFYEYSTGDAQVKLDLESEIQRLQKNGMSQYVSLAKARFAEEKKLAEMQFAWDVTNHRFTEEQKLRFSFNIKEQEVVADAKLTKDQREARLQSLDEQYAIELQILKTSQAKELLQTKQHWMSAEDYARDYYALIREEILATSSYSPEMKQALVKEANFNQGMDQNAGREQVWGEYQDRFGMGDSPYQQDIDLLKDAREQMLITDSEYFAARYQLGLSASSGMLSTMTDLMGSLLGEQSTGYKAMFAVQKAFAVAEILMNAPKSYSKAFDAMIGIPYVGPVLAPIAGGAAIAAQLAQAASVKSISLSGMAHDGIDNIPKEGTWLLDKGERVVDSRTNSDLKNFIKDGGGVTVNVNVPPGYTANQHQDSQGNVTIDVVKQEIAGAFSNVGRANSHESRSIQSAFGLAPAR